MCLILYKILIIYTRKPVDPLHKIYVTKLNCENHISNASHIKNTFKNDIYHGCRVYRNIVCIIVGYTLCYQ